MSTFTSQVDGTEAEVDNSGRLTFYEITDPAAPDANYAIVYARDDGAGLTELVVRFASGAVQRLALQGGTGFQPLDSDLTAIALLTTAVYGRGLLEATDAADLLAYIDADIASWAAVTRASGFDTFAATPSSANLRSLVTDETGTGLLVFGTSPTLTDPLIVGTINEDIFTITDAAAFQIDPGNGSIQLITLTASRTPLATNFLAGDSVTLMIADGTAYTITWSGVGVTWVGGTAPTLATSGYTVVELWKVGSTIYGARVGDVA